ncbi:DNA ligase D [Pseudonocardia dioxanivorans]|uniref:DNA ligase D n=1 Tax=Pseudonocardia dioxanivorans TaxID=240495 RepID=UPI000CD0055E|nr:DNA ligase D [Pseudonocardia dioxanivorans]
MPARRPDAALRPMLATPGRPPSGPGWAAEFKWDGVRALLDVDDAGEVHLTSRNGNDVTLGYPDLLAGVDTGQPLVLDGEIVALDEAGRPDFGLLQNRMHVRHPSGPLLAEVPVRFYAFDVLRVGQRSLLRETYDDRRAALAGLGVDGWARFAVPPSTTEVPPAQMLDVAREHGLEGIVAKRRTSRYEPGRRAASWVKTALFTTREVVLGGWTPGQGRRGALGSLLLGAYDDEGRLHYLGNVGSGFSEAALRSLREKLEQLRSDEDPFASGVPREHARGVRWVQPRLVGEVEYRTLTHDARLRHSVWRGLRPDRDPHEVRIDGAFARAPLASYGVRAPAPEPARAPAASEAAEAASARAEAAAERVRAATGDELAALDALRRKGTWHVAGEEVALTNLDKVLFPGRDGGPPVTKRDFVRYHARVAPYLLPYLQGRPVNMQRFPDGVAREGFWQKEIPVHAPDWVTRWRYPDAEPGDVQDYVVVDSTATLVWLANLAAVELHPWTSRLPDVHRPTWALIDIDPGPRTAFDEVLAVARLYRAALDHLGVAAAPKVTGKRGVQIWVPVTPGPTFADTRGWVEKVSRAVGRMVPELISWEWHTDRRAGRMRLDYTQNVINKTLVAPFSARPAAGAPVSMTLSWDELDDPELRPDRWTVGTALDRLDAVGDPMFPLLGREQVLPALGGV